MAVLRVREPSPALVLVFRTCRVRQAGRVPYGGPELPDDADYSWRVRVRDSAGALGPWSESRRFSTGLSEGGWGDDRIHRGPGGRAPLEILDGSLRVAGSPFLPIPCRPVRHPGRWTFSPASAS